MNLRILYFAALREAVGSAGEQVRVPASVRTVGELQAWIAARGEPWAGAFARVSGVRAALDQELARPEQPLHEAAEVAFFPPVTGG